MQHGDQANVKEIPAMVAVVRIEAPIPMNLARSGRHSSRMGW